MASDCEVRTLSSIGSEIKSWCKQNKVNQTELAAALDVSTMTVRRVWKGTKELTSVQIAIMLEVIRNVHRRKGLCLQYRTSIWNLYCA